MIERIEVLNHGYIQLVDRMGNDLSIVRSARVSYNADKNENDDKRLIEYLYLHKHSTPFESVVFTFEIQAPIFVLRQWHRHRTQSYNEVSARYTQLPELYFVPDPWLIGKQDVKNRQKRNVLTEVQYNLLDCKDKDNLCYLVALMDKQNRLAFQLYRQLLNEGVPRELARSVLPTGTYSRMFATANLWNWFRFLKERLQDTAQYEIKVYAKAILSLIELYVPIAVECFKKRDNYDQVF